MESESHVVSIVMVFLHVSIVNYVRIVSIVMARICVSIRDNVRNVANVAEHLCAYIRSDVTCVRFAILVFIVVMLRIGHAIEDPHNISLISKIISWILK